MKLSDLFPRKYASGEDLQGKSLTLTISHIEVEPMRAGPQGPAVEKPVIYFKDAKKGVVLCRTLAYQIADILGSPDTDTWAGRSIVLVPEPVAVAGRNRIAIRARSIQPAAPTNGNGSSNAYNV